MAWLLRDGDVLAAVEAGFKRGVPIQGAVLVRGMVLPSTGTAVDAAWCGDGVDDHGALCLEVRRIRAVGSTRIGRPRLGRGVVVLAQQGAFERWKLKVGDRLEVREV